MKSFLQRSNTLGVFLALLFILCFIWYWVHPVQQALHLGILELLFFGYSGMNIGSFILGLVQSYIWGYLFMGMWSLSCCSSCCSKKN